MILTDHGKSKTNVMKSNNNNKNLNNILSPEDSYKRATTSSESTALPTNRKRKKKTELESLYDNLAFIYSQNDSLNKRTKECLETFNQKQESVIKNICFPKRERQAEPKRRSSIKDIGGIVKTSNGIEKRQVIIIFLCNYMTDFIWLIDIKEK